MNEEREVPVRRAMDPSDDESRPEEMPDGDEARARARERSHDPDATEMGTAATAERWDRLAAASEREHLRDEEELGESGHRDLSGPVHDHDENASDRDDDPSTLPLNDPEVRGTFERYQLGEDMDGERINNEPPGR